APNEIATFTFTITAPVTPGAYAFQWRMVQDGVEWFGQYSPLTYINVISNAHFVSHSVPSIMQIGHTYSVSVTMQNIGRTAWPAVVPAGQQPQYRLGSRNTQDNSVWGTGRVNLPYDVPASGNVTFSFNVTAPATPGVYNFQWQMLDEGYVWLGELTQNLAINVTADGTYTPPAAGNAIISELRLRGPAGPADDFIA